MPHVRSLPVLACVVALAGAIPSVAHEPSASGGGFLLDPDPDGTYAVPYGTDDFLPLEFDAGETPFRLVDLRFDPERGSMVAKIRYVGEKPATAWAVRLAQISATGTELSAATSTEDVARTVEPGNGIRTKPTTELVHDKGLLLPGQALLSDLGAPAPTADAPGADAGETAALVLGVPVVVFADTSFAGSARMARQILGERKVGAEELAYWSERLGALAARAATQEEAVAGVEALLAELEADVGHLPHAAQAARANFRRNLKGVLGTDELRQKSTLWELRSLSEWYRGLVEKEVRHVPAELPEVPEPPKDQGWLQERVIGENGGENCQCGGSITYTLSRHESQVCGVENGWQISETWNYTCRNESGGSTGEGGTGNLNGYGACIQGQMCFDDRYCPPSFTGPTQSRDMQTITWNRTVLDNQIAVGFCTSRCVFGNSRSLTFQCLCSPPPDPSCDTHFCPILIETGAAGFRLTDAADGVLFDIDADGVAERVSWPVPATDDAWLALDRNGNGTIDSGAELFGDATAQPESDEPNGFLALAVFDRPENGGDGDGRITAADAVFGNLLLWIDGDHDGVSDPSELTSLNQAGIVTLELEYHEARRSDRHGNEFRYLAGVWHASGARRLAQDVFLLLD